MTKDYWRRSVMRLDAAQCTFNTKRVQIMHSVIGIRLIRIETLLAQLFLFSGNIRCRESQKEKALKYFVLLRSLWRWVLIGLGEVLSTSASTRHK